MLDPRHARKGGFRAFAALDHEQQLVREAIADVTAAAVAPAADAPAGPTAAAAPASTWIIPPAARLPS